jgi:hypothetical protein
MNPPLRAIAHVAVPVLVHTGITVAIGAILLFACAGWQLLTQAAP